MFPEFQGSLIPFIHYWENGKEFILYLEKLKVIQDWTMVQAVEI